ncbi:HprK-related kinase A [Pseudomaricurvus sp.]|uniref:HprK-related kinase A n=1 Tax=Pseudomaricurvus sp. TaxID=2004510 RepID=UPI003F6D612D
MSSKQISLKVGPFSILVTSGIDEVIAGVDRLYGHYPANDNAFHDFHVSVDAASGFRRWWRPQANFTLDGILPFKPLPKTQALPMFEWGLNWCMTSYCHEYLVIHAAVIEKQGKVLLLSAPPGAGKSTLCAGLVCRGWRLLSDELAFVRLDGTSSVVPLARPVCLKNRAIEVIQGFSPEAQIGPVCPDTAKGDVAHMLAPVDSVNRSHEEAEINWVVFPRYIKGAVTSLSQRSKAQSFLNLARQSFNFNVLGDEGFDTLNHVITHSDCYDFQYSNLDEAIAMFDKMAESAGKSERAIEIQ